MWYWFDPNGLKYFNSIFHSRKSSCCYHDHNMFWHVNLKLFEHVFTVFEVQAFTLIINYLILLIYVCYRYFTDIYFTFKPSRYREIINFSWRISQRSSKWPPLMFWWGTHYEYIRDNIFYGYILVSPPPRFLEEWKFC